MDTLVSMDLFRTHLRLDDITGEDGYLQAALETAEQNVLDSIGYTRDELSVIPEGIFPAPVRWAILMRGADLYAYRESMDSSQLAALPYGVPALLKPYQRMRGGSLMDRLIAGCQPQDTEGGGA